MRQNSVRHICAISLFVGIIGVGQETHPQVRSDGVPVFQADPSWPKPLPKNWVLGMVASIAVDSKDHVWILHRPATVPEAAIAAGKTVAPPVVEFDPAGNLVQAWGGPGHGHPWFEAGSAPSPVGTPAEHGIFVDHNDNVWLAGNGHIVLKFTRAGKLVKQLGELWKPVDGSCKVDCAHSNDTAHFGNPTDLVVDPKTNELFVSDGYVNRRIIVFDASTGAYKRHWGAYGKRPQDLPVPTAYDPKGPIPQQFFKVHCVTLSRDGLVYVCDRTHDRIQVFRPDGTFVKEAFVVPEAHDATTGSIWRIGFSADPEQRFAYVADSRKSKIWILRRNDLQVVGSFDSRGNHHMAGADSKGNLYSSGGRSPQKFVLMASTK